MQKNIAQIKIYKRRPIRSTMAKFRPPKEICFSTDHTAEAWRKWELAFRIYYTAAELSKKEGKTQVAILLLNIQHSCIVSPD